MEEERRRDGKEEGGGRGGEPPTMLSGRKVANSHCLSKTCCWDGVCLWSQTMIMF